MTQSLAAAGTNAAAGLDPRGPRFAAGITTAVLALTLVLHATAVGFVLLALQTVVFAIGAFRGPSATPYAALFRRFVRPRLGPPEELEDVRPVRFAQAVGLGFSVVALVGLAFLPVLGVLALAAAFVAAFLNAVFGYCLGCEVYLLLRRIAPRHPLT
jgi:putative Mn2+ efflux pump MntP